MEVDPLNSVKRGLLLHPSASATAVERVSISVGPTFHGLEVIYVVEGQTDQVVCRTKETPRREDQLWRSTCFELFIRGENAEYFEYNFSPSNLWAAYRFQAYRAGMEPLLIHAPAINVWDTGSRLVVSVHIDMPTLPRGPMAISAIIEEVDGTKSYWALAHPPEGPPDFHHPACFTLELPPPSEA